jgi:predicted dehydrogenase
VWPEGYDRKFAADQKIPTVCARLEEMPAHVDAAMVHGVDWEKHIDKARVFMEAGKPVLIDKPVVGSARDCDRLLEMQAKHGTPVFGGSSLRYASEVTALRESIGGREHVLSVVAAGPGDFFSYGIHTTEMLQGLIGPGARSVRVVASRPTPVFAVTYDHEVTALVMLQLPHHEWSIAAYTDAGIRQTTVSVENLYRPFLENFIAMVRGTLRTDALSGPVEAVRVHLAASLALETGQTVRLEELPPDASFDGKAFAREYAEAKRKQAPL